MQITFDKDGRANFRRIEPNGDVWRGVFAPDEMADALPLLTLAERAALRAVWTTAVIAAWVAAHPKPPAVPTVDFGSVPCANADDVDRVTAARIRNLVAGNKRGDSVDEAMAAILHRAVMLLLIGAANQTPAQKTQAAAILATYQQIDVIRRQGEVFKAANFP